MKLLAMTILLLCSSGGNTVSSSIKLNQKKHMNSITEKLTLYVQYEKLKGIRVGASVKLNQKIIGKVVQIDENPDAFILMLKIDPDVQIPILSKFRIATDQNEIDFIDIELSDKERMLKDNEYFSGQE